LKNKLSVLCAISALFCLIIASEQIIQGARNSLMLCITTIVPSLFPFVVLTKILARIGFAEKASVFFESAARKFLCISGFGMSAFIIGICGGYPTGCAYITDMYEQQKISKSEAERLLSFCNNSGPAFLVGVVGVGVFKSAKIGIILYLIHIFSALLVGRITRKDAIFSETSSDNSPCEIIRAFSKSITDAVVITLNVCGNIVTFSIFISLLKVLPYASHLSDNSYVYALIQGCIELGSGTAALSQLEAAPLSLALSSFIVGWGGLCVHMQTMSLLADTNLKGTPFITGRLLCAIISALLTYSVFCIIRI